MVVGFSPGRQSVGLSIPAPLKNRFHSSIYDSTTTEFGCESKLHMYPASASHLLVAHIHGDMFNIQPTARPEAQKEGSR